MSSQRKWILIAVGAAFCVSPGETPALAQTAGARGQTSAPRQTSDGKPDLNGIWQALNTAAWDIQDPAGQQLGIPPGQGVVEGNEIPYLPSALAKKQQNFANRATADPAEAH
jgi:hypothetical protein